MLGGIIGFVITGSFGAYCALRMSINQPPVFTHFERSLGGVFFATWASAVCYVSIVAGHALSK